MTTQPTTHRRWFRFSLRTLLIVVALAAVGAWAYWIGWPWWQEYRERTSVEKLFMTFRRGMTTDQCWKVFSDDHFRKAGFQATSRGKMGSGTIDTDAGKAMYVAFMELEPNAADGTVNTCKRIELYQLPLPQFDYKPRTEHGITLKSMNTNQPSGSYEFARMLYMADFNEFITGDRKNNPGFQYELIYSDPPPGDRPH